VIVAKVDLDEFCIRLILTSIANICISRNSICISFPSKHTVENHSSKLKSKLKLVSLIILVIN